MKVIFVFIGLLVIITDSSVGISTPFDNIGQMLAAEDYFEDFSIVANSDLWLKGQQAIYDPNIAYYLWKLNQICGCPNDQIQNWSCRNCKARIPGMTDVMLMYNTDHGSFDYVGYDSQRNAIVVVFRGTVNGQNVLQDLNFFMRPWNRCQNCQISEGWGINYESLRGQTLANVKTLKQKYPNAQIWVTGHSLGGAVAALGALDIALQIAPVDVFYSFEAPATGNDYFANFFDSKIYDPIRISHGADPAINVLPSFAGFKHFGTEIWYQTRMWNVYPYGNYIKCDGSGHDSRCVSQYLITFAWNDHCQLFGEDCGCNYV